MSVPTGIRDITELQKLHAVVIQSIQTNLLDLHFKQ